MRPVTTEKTTSTYGAPRGLESEVGGLPYYRENDGTAVNVCSVWEPTDEERKQIAEGANILLGIWGEPIPPVFVEVTDQKAVDSVALPDHDSAKE